MSLSGCARDLAMGLASTVGGWVVIQEPSGRLNNFNVIGWMAVAAGIISVWLASRVRVKDVATPAANSNGGGNVMPDIELDGLTVP